MTSKRQIQAAMKNNGIPGVIARNQWGTTSWFWYPAGIGRDGETPTAAWVTANDWPECHFIASCLNWNTTDAIIKKIAAANANR